MEVEGFREAIGADESLLNKVSQYDVSGIEVRDGVATVFLLTLGEAPNNPVLRDVAAQLVWTLTGADNVDRVLFNIDGELALIPTTNTDNTTTNEPVTTDDYQDYNPEDTDTETTTTSSTTTTTTVPPADG
jgi:spore germination protein GerM